MPDSSPTTTMVDDITKNNMYIEENTPTFKLDDDQSPTCISAVLEISNTNKNEMEELVSTSSEMVGTNNNKRRRSTIITFLHRLEEEHNILFYTSLLFGILLIGSVGYILGSSTSSTQTQDVYNNNTNISGSSGQLRTSPQQKHSSSSIDNNSQMIINNVPPPTSMPSQQHKETSTHHPEKKCQPRHVHLSVGSTQNKTHSSMIISFSFLPGCGAHTSKVGAVRISENMNDIQEDDDDESDSSTLVIGNIKESLHYNTSYTKELLRQAKKRGSAETHYFSDVYYHIEVNDLKPGTRYYYKCMLIHISKNHQNVEIITQSEQSSFLTPPSPGEWYPPPLDKTIKFAVLGDLGVRPHSRETIKSIEQSHCDSDVNDEQAFHCHHSQGIDALILAGDLSYANNNHAVWDDWFDMFAEHSFFTSIPMQIALGNHDLDHVDTLEIAVAYEKRFRMPRVKPAVRELAPNSLFCTNVDDCSDDETHMQAQTYVPYEWGNAYYSYIFGPSKQIFLSSYSSFRPGSIQYKWLISELESVDRSITPWLIVVLHCPLYNTFKIHRRELFLVEAAKYLEPLFVQYTVNFVLSGHIHSYMRSVPTINSKPHPKGPVHIIQGNGGRQANEPYYNELAEEWVHVRDHSQYGYGTLELFNRTHVCWKWVKTGFNSEGEGGSKGRFEPEFDLTDEEYIINQFLVNDMGELIDQEDESDKSSFYWETADP